MGHKYNRPWCVPEGGHMNDVLEDAQLREHLSARPSNDMLEVLRRSRGDGNASNS